MILLLTLVSLLPWGAYAAAHSARVAHAAGLIKRHAVILASSEETHATNPVPQPTLALAPKKCRTATLPGFSCSPDPAIHLTLAVEPTPQRGAAFRNTRDWTGASAAEAPPTGPPRSI